MSSLAKKEYFHIPSLRLGMAFPWGAQPSAKHTSLGKKRKTSDLSCAPQNSKALSAAPSAGISSTPKQAEGNMPELLWPHCTANLRGGESSWVSPPKKPSRHNPVLPGKKRVGGVSRPQQSFKAHFPPGLCSSNSALLICEML